MIEKISNNKDTGCGQNHESFQQSNRFSTHRYIDEYHGTVLQGDGGIVEQIAE